MRKWKTEDRETKLDTPWFRIVRETVKLPNKIIYPDYYVMEIPDVAMVIPVTAKGAVILVKQYKHAIQEVMVEFPAGYVDEGESPKEAAERELLEETGYIAKTMTPLTILTNAPTRARQRIHVFVAEGVVGGKKQKLDITEKIEVLELPLEAVVKMIAEREIWASDTVAGMFVYLYKFHRDKKW